MGLGSWIAGLGVTAGVFFGIIGLMLLMIPLIGWLFAVPFFAVGIAAIIAGLTGGATAGVAKKVYHSTNSTAYCEQCGNQVNKSAKYCGECGEKV
ncbi:MAG: zinc ribbon domain-containing protein [Candidatus Woesearchaeota archaeon]|nr:zinc ribbon domain-containing protein [Candidatus Woesearchaeota archaeon]